MATLGQFLGFGIVLDPYPQVAALRRQALVHEIDMRRHLGAPPDILIEDLDSHATFEIGANLRLDRGCSVNETRRGRWLIPWALPVVRAPTGPESFPSACHCAQCISP
jgi:hypothetical protein